MYIDKIHANEKIEIDRVRKSKWQLLNKQYTKNVLSNSSIYDDLFRKKVHV